MTFLHTESSIPILSQELQVDFVSAAAILTLFAAELERRRTGCIAAITSVAGDRVRRSNYVYGSAKGGLSLFLQGLRSRLYPAGVRVITIKPGPVQTPMTDGLLHAARFADPRRWLAISSAASNTAPRTSSTRQKSGATL